MLCKLIGLIATQGGVCVYIYIYIYIYMLLMKMMNPPHTQLSIFQNDKYINLIYNQTSVSISMWLKFTCRLLWCKAVGLIYSHTREIAAFKATLPLKLIQIKFILVFSNCQCHSTIKAKSYAWSIFHSFRYKYFLLRRSYYLILFPNPIFIFFCWEFWVKL